MKTRSLLLSAVALAFIASPALAQHGHDHGSARPATAAAGTVKDGVRTIEMAVTQNGFEPAHVKVKQGEKVRFVVTRKTDRTCAKEIVIDGHGVREALPLDKPVTVEFTPATSGELRYQCGHGGHIRGVVTVS
jgi:plastocyanin domain-containing protein